MCTFWFSLNEKYNKIQCNREQEQKLAWSSHVTAVVHRMRCATLRRISNRQQKKFHATFNARSYVCVCLNRSCFSSFFTVFLWFICQAAFTSPAARWTHIPEQEQRYSMHQLCVVWLLSTWEFTYLKKVLVPKQNKKTILILIKPNETKTTAQCYLLLLLATCTNVICWISFCMQFCCCDFLFCMLFIGFVSLSACFLIACLLDATNSMFLRSLNGTEICVQLILYCLVFGDLIKKQKKSIIDPGRGKYTFKYNRNNQPKRRNKRPDLVKLLFVFLHCTGCFTFLFKPENSTISKYDFGF